MDSKESQGREAQGSGSVEHVQKRQVREGEKSHRCWQVSGRDARNGSVEGTEKASGGQTVAGNFVLKNVSLYSN